MAKTSCLIIFETSMNHRYAQMASIHGFQVYEVGLNNTWKNGFTENLKERLNSKHSILEKRSLFIKYLNENNYERLFLSNAEGYISKNFIHSIRNKYPELKIIALQHGIFPLKQPFYKNIIRNAINNFMFTLTGIYPLGSGFGGIKLDGYYVYSEREKNFLIANKGWDSSKVFVDLKFIKPEIYNEYIRLKKSNPHERDTAIFLLQGLHLAGICSQEVEVCLIEKTIYYLAKKYQNVLIKEHPACTGRLNSIQFPENVKEVTNLFEGFSQAQFAYSFFSTALIDAKIFELKTFGIRSNKINVDVEIYDNFDININFEENIAT